MKLTTNDLNTILNTPEDHLIKIGDGEFYWNYSFDHTTKRIYYFSRTGKKADTLVVTFDSFGDIIQGSLQSFGSFLIYSKTID